jgi:hypothetical protein
MADFPCSEFDDFLWRGLETSNVPFEADPFPFPVEPPEDDLEAELEP